jgi:hypothetical protein
MWLKISVILRIFKLTAVAIILWHGIIILKLALGTGPCKNNFILVFVFVYIQNPRLYALQVHADVTT